MSRIYKMHFITNLHAGSGEANFGVIDNEVQRDALGFPTIHGSGVKGALREFCRGADVSDDDMTKWFGSDAKTSTEKKEASKPGVLKFFPATLLSMPVRSSMKRPFYRATCYPLLYHLETMFAAFGQPPHEDLFSEIRSVENGHTSGATLLNETVPNGTFVEGIPVSKCIRLLQYERMRKWIGDHVVLLRDADFASIPLPIVARNCLNNGESTNLWYEEFVPRESVFFTMILDDDRNDAHLDALEKVITKRAVQFGGNASVGYGYARISRLEG